METTTKLHSVPEHETGESRDASKIGIWQLPKLLWAGTILFSANLIIASSIFISPEIDVDIYGEAASGVLSAGSKTSPFVAEQPKKPRAARVAVKLRPIVEVNPEAVVAGQQFDLSQYTMPAESVPLVRTSAAEPHPARLNDGKLVIN